MEGRSESVNGIVFKENRESVLLVKRRDVPVWVLPGGGIDENETPEESCIREILEETGLHTSILRKVGEYSPKNKLSKFTHVFEVNTLDGELVLTDETQDIQFFPIDKLPKLMPLPYKNWIKDASSNKHEIIKKPVIGASYFQFIKNLIIHPILVFRYLLSKIGLTIND